jgi:hypothetical protein
MVYVIIYGIVAYLCLNSLQRRASIMYFGTLGQYFMGKIVAALLFGWVIIPVWVIMALLGKLFGR